MTAIITAVALMTAAPCQTTECHMRVTERPYHQLLTRIAHCESRGQWHLNTGNGYYGGLQFDRRTWRGVGGRGLPSRASELEQRYRASRLIRRHGTAPWPVCGS